MIWFFERRNEFLRIETSFEHAAGVFTLRAQLPDGTEQVETFTDEQACHARLEVLDRQLRADEWRLRQVRPM